MAPRYCSTCGSAVSDGARFCGRCGAAVLATPAGVPYAQRAAEAVQYAGFWVRFAAAFIDGIVISIFTQPITLAIGQGFEVNVVEDTAGNVIDFSFEVDEGRLFLSFLISTILPVIYYAVAFSRWGQTLGALAMSIKVVHPDGSLLSPARAVVRWLGAYVSALVLGLGYLWMIWDPRKQTWHDKMAGAVVIKVKRPGEV